MGKVDRRRQRRADEHRRRSKAGDGGRSTSDAILDAAAVAETQRRALGVAVDSTAPDDALFFHDRGALNSEQLLAKNAADARSQQAAARRRPALRSEAALTPNEFVRAVKQGRPAAAKVLSDGVAPAEVAAVDKLLRSGAYARRLRRSSSRTTAETEALYDPWDAPAAPPKHEAEWWHTKAPNRTVVATDNAEAALADAKRREVAPAGMSVNPPDDAHQDLLGEAVAAQLDEEMRVERLGKHVRLRRFDGGGGGEIPGEDMVDDGGADGGDGADDDGEEGARRPNPQRKARTRVQRNRELIQKRLRRDAAERRKVRAQRRDIDRVEELLEARKDELTPTADDVSRALRVRRRTRVGGVRLPAERVEVPLSSELRASLRAVKATGSVNVLRGRLASWRRQGLVVPSARK